MARVSRIVQTYSYGLSDNTRFPAHMQLVAPRTRDASAAVFSITFYEGDPPPGPSTRITVVDRRVDVKVYLPMRRLGVCVDLVRNERPVRASASDLNNDPFFDLSCSDEPPGEGPGEPPAGG